MKISSASNSSSNAFSSSTQDLPSKTIVIVWCSAFAVEAFFIVTGNLLTILFFAVNKKLHKKSLVLVINMAFADLLFGGVFLPLYVYFLADHNQLWRVRLRTPLHMFSLITQIGFSQASVLSAALISGERFYAICWPLRHRTLTMRVYWIVILMAWTVVVLVSTAYPLSNPFGLNRHKHVFIFLSYFLVLVFIVCSCNIGIWRKFRHRSVASHQKNGTSHNKRLTKTLLFVSISGVVSLLPSTIGSFLVSFWKVSIPWSIAQTMRFLCFSNAFVNPVVYALRIPEFRQALGLCCSREQAHKFMNPEYNQRRDNRAAASAPIIEPGTKRSDSSDPQPLCEQEGFDTKL